jgi:2-polyprenyl-3-methyl-5-hydroxy-6-metoxy-1,4-benzoquinol methylase
MLYVNCNLCGSKENKFLFSVSQFTTALTIVQCKRCGFIYQNPRPDKTELKSLYSDEYYSGTTATSYITDFNKIKFISNERFKVIEKIIHPGRLLDIGCHTGALLSCAQERGWDTYGTDISSFIVEEAKKVTPNIYTGEIREINFKEKFFDLITLFEVIEHLEKPLEDLIQMHSILKDEGLLVVQTANMCSLRAKTIRPKKYYYQPHHLSYFTKRTLIKMAEKAGFKCIRIFNGSEIAFLSELRLFRDSVLWPRLLLRKLLNGVSFGNFTLNSTIVCYFKKA